MLKEQPPVDSKLTYTKAVYTHTHIHNHSNIHNLLIMSGPGIEPLTFADISHLAP